MDYYKRYMGDYQRDTGDLSLAEHGAYSVLLDHYYSVRKPIPAPLEKLHRLCRATTKLEQEAVEAVANEFFPVGDDGLRHNWRADEELAKWDEKTSGAASSGKLGAEARWGKQKQKDTRSQRLSAARKLATHTEVEWQCLIQICGRKCLRCNTPVDSLEGGAVCKDHIRPLYLGGSDGIENIQPLCRQCNTGKKSDVTDLRPSDWKERLSKCLANAIESSSQNGSLTPSKMGGTQMAIQNPDPDPDPNPEPRSQNKKEIENAHARAREAGVGFSPLTLEQAQQLQLAYPRGIYRESEWLVVQKLINQHLDAGVEFERILDSFVRYEAQQRAKGNIGREFVLSPVKHCDLTKPLFDEPFPLPRSKSESNVESNVSNGLAFLAGDAK